VVFEEFALELMPEAKLTAAGNCGRNQDRGVADPLWSDLDARDVFAVANDENFQHFRDDMH